VHIESEWRQICPKQHVGSVRVRADATGLARSSSTYAADFTLNCYPVKSLGLDYGPCGRPLPFPVRLEPVSSRRRLFLYPFASRLKEASGQLKASNPLRSTIGKRSNLAHYHHDFRSFTARSNQPRYRFGFHSAVRGGYHVSAIALCSSGVPSRGGIPGS
jgi:hypothetical protein